VTVYATPAITSLASFICINMERMNGEIRQRKNHGGTKNQRHSNPPRLPYFCEFAQKIRIRDREKKILTNSQMPKPPKQVKSNLVIEQLKVTESFFVPLVC
jgi:hypothetical protein